MSEYSEHFYRSADDRLNLFARDYAGDGPPLLLMHGLTRNSADFEPLIDHLIGKYRLIVPDQRGRGRSQNDDQQANYRPDIYVADMRALLDGLGLDVVTAIGTSMGGLMAMLMAAFMPGRVRAMVLNDIGTEIMPEGIARIKGYVGGGEPVDSWEQAAKHCAEIAGDAMPNFTHKDWLAFAHRTFRTRDDGKIELAYDPAIAAAMKAAEESAVPPDLWPLWDSISAVPVLMIRGAISDLLSGETVREMQARHDGPFFSAEVPERGHAPILDEPESLDAILPFLGKYA